MLTALMLFPLPGTVFFTFFLAFTWLNLAAIFKCHGHYAIQESLSPWHILSTHTHTLWHTQKHRRKYRYTHYTHRLCHPMVITLILPWHLNSCTKLPVDFSRDPSMLGVHGGQGPCLIHLGPSTTPCVAKSPQSAWLMLNVREQPGCPCAGPAWSEKGCAHEPSPKASPMPGPEQDVCFLIYILWGAMCYVSSSITHVTNVLLLQNVLLFWQIAMECHHFNLNWGRHTAELQGTLALGSRCLTSDMRFPTW